MTQYKKKIIEQEERLLREKMSNTITSIYSQWDRRKPDTQIASYTDITFADGTMTRSKQTDHKSVERFKYTKPMRKWLFKKFYDTK